MPSLACTQCGCIIPQRRAFISLLVFGDEEIRSWYLCPACRVWSVEEYTDRFLGDSSAFVRGPFPEEACAADVKLVDTCPDPASKFCHCPAHQRLGP